MPRKTKKYYADGEIVEGSSRIILENQNKTVDHILGKQLLGEYEQTTESAYLQWLEAQSDLDIQKECIKRNLFANNNRKINVDKLVKRFHEQSVRAAVLNENPIATNVNLTKEQKQALEKGSNKVS